MNKIKLTETTEFVGFYKVISIYENGVGLIWFTGRNFTEIGKNKPDFDHENNIFAGQCEFSKWRQVKIGDEVKLYRTKGPYYLYLRVKLMNDKN
jgi:hypothetical protein